ncbi:MAG: O-antigen ligase family protein, partial [Gemmatimonadales bacterium]
FRTANQDVGIIKFKTYIQLFLVLWMIWELAPEPRKQFGLLLAYVLGAYVAAFNTIYVYHSEVGLERRFAAEGFDPNDLGMTLALAIPMAWYLGMTYRQPILRWACRAYILVGIVALGLTGSRGAMLASMVALLIVPLTMTKMTPGKMIAATFLLCAAGGVAVAFIPQTSFQRLGSTKSEVEEGTLNGRIQIWKAGVHAFTQKPVLGYGTGGFDWAIIPWLGHERPPHNAYLGVLVEQGIIGFFLWIMMFISVLFPVMKLPPLERRFALVLMATMAVAMLPLGWDDRKPVWFIVGILAALSESMTQRRAAPPPVVEAVPLRPLRPVRRPPPPREPRIQPAPRPSPRLKRDGTA